MEFLSRRAQGLIAVNIAAVIFGTAALYGKLDVSPFWIVDMRAIFAAITLFCVGRMRGQIVLPGRALRLPLLMSGILLAVHWVTFFLSVQMAGVAIATLTFAAFPMFTIIMQALKGRRVPHFVEIAAGIIIIVAVGLLIRIDSAAPSILPGTIYGLLSALAFAWFGLSSQKLGGSLPNITVSFSQNVIVASVLLPTLLFAAPAPHTGLEWFFLLLLGMFSTAVMHQVYFFALQRLSAATCGAFVALEPVYAILFAALLFAEPVTARVVLSGLLILGASFLLLRQERRIVEMV